MKRPLLLLLSASSFSACWDFDKFLRERCADGGIMNCTPPAVPTYDVAIPAEPICFDTWCPENPLPHAQDITALWGAGPQDVWLGTHTGLVMHYDRGTWTRRDAGLDTVADIWGRGTSEVYFVGGNHRPVLWNGAGFNDVGSKAGPLPSFAITGTPTTLYWGTSPYLMQKTGTNELDISFGTADWEVRSIAANSDTDCYALVVPGMSSVRRLVQCDGGGDTDAGVIDVLWSGNNGDLWGGGLEQLVRRAPNSDTTTTALPFNVREGFAIPGGNDVIAVGSGTQLYWREGAPTVQARIAPGDDRALLSVWSSGPDDIWVGGQSGLLWHWNGAKDVWQTVNRGTLAELYSVARTPNGLLAVGDDGVFERTDAGSWEKTAYVPDGPIRALSLLPDGGGYGVGRRIHSFFGAPDAVMETPIDELLAVFTRSADDAWAVGNEVWQRTAAGWVPRTDIPRPQQALFGVAGDDNHAWAVGRESDGGALVYELLRDGGYRQESTVTPNVELHAITMLPDGGFIAGGGACAIFESSWTTGATCATGMDNVTIYAAWSDGADSWLVGDRGVVIDRFMGVNKTVPTGLSTVNRLTGVIGISEKGVWITGTHGIVMHHP